MVVLQKSNGQLCNKLLIASHAIAYATSENEVLIDFIIAEYADYFPIVPFIKKKIFLFKSKKIQRLLNLTLKVVNKLTLIIGSSNFFDRYCIDWVHTEIRGLSRQKRTLILEGEGFRSTLDIKKKHEIIKSLFTPKKRYIYHTDGIIKSLKTSSNILIGIHLRKGDYKYWQGGKYYYDDTLYLEIIEEVKSLFKDQNPVFILCSDQKIDKSQFSANDIYISDNEMIVDLLLLSRCNYLIGPPSTFSGWASFYGDAPLFIVEERNYPIKKEGFRKFTL